VTGERDLIVPGHPSRGIRGEFGGMALQGDQILERGGIIELGGVDQTHEHVTDVGAGEGSIEQGIFPMQDRLLQRSFGRVVVEGRPFDPQEQSQLRPALLHVEDRRTERSNGCSTHSGRVRSFRRNRAIGILSSGGTFIDVDTVARSI
jgi:hypothetical protein